jgi:hypothetical protein
MSDEFYEREDLIDWKQELEEAVSEHPFRGAPPSSPHFQLYIINRMLKLEAALRDARRAIAHIAEWGRSDDGYNERQTVKQIDAVLAEGGGVPTGDAEPTDPCPTCGGKGHVLNASCEDCGGSGVA